MGTERAQFGGISRGTVILLLIWFLVFAVGDFATTFWLILHDPAGIANEGNPLAASLYNGGGLVALIFAKVGVCVILELAFVFLWSRYSFISWFRGTLETLILSLIGYSLIIVYNNFLAIMVIQALLIPDLLKEMRVVEMGMLILALILNNLLLYFSKVKEIWMYIEASVAALVFLGPLILWRPFFQRYLREQPLFYFAYLGSVVTILAITFYITNEVAKERKRKIRN